MSDFHFSNHGSIWLCTPTNAAAALHLKENVSDEAQWYAGALAVEPRYVENLVAGLSDAGFSVA